MSAEPAIGLTDLEVDALSELMNLGVSNAALSLSEMIREEVVLSVPKVAVLTRRQAIAALSEHAARRLVAVQQDFEGEITGRALLIFPETKSIELVRSLVGGTLSLEDITELEQEALAETGNVLLNGCLGTIANQLERSLKISLPEVIYGEGSELFDTSADSGDRSSVLFVYINFSVRNRDIQGYIAMVMDLPSLIALKELVGLFIQRATSDHHAA